MVNNIFLTKHYLKLFSHFIIIPLRISFHQFTIFPPYLFVQSDHRKKPQTLRNPSSIQLQSQSYPKDPIHRTKAFHPFPLREDKIQPTLLNIPTHKKKEPSSNSKPDSANHTDTKPHLLIRHNLHFQLSKALFPLEDLARKPGVGPPHQKDQERFFSLEESERPFCSMEAPTSSTTPWTPVP